MKAKKQAPKPRAASKQKPPPKVATTSTENNSRWIPIEQPLEVTPGVIEVIKRLDRAGHVAYLVGGTVRDGLLGIPTADHDIATSALPDEVEELFENTISVGKEFGVVRVQISDRGNPEIIEVATFREDLRYRDHRHPEGVRFSTPEADATRRDFTINGLFYDPKTRRILDTVGGVTDLRSSILRAIGDPSVRFKEDSLRLLRAVRFSARLGLRIEAETWAAVVKHARLITKVSPERIREELTDMLTGNAPAISVMLLEQSGLLEWVLPEIKSTKNRLQVLDFLIRFSPEDRSPALAWSALLMDCYRSQGAVVLKKIAERLRFSNHLTERVLTLCEHQHRFREAFEMRESTLKRWVTSPGFDELLVLERAEAMVTTGDLAPYEFARSTALEISRSDVASGSRILNGDDLIEIGLRPGPHFSEILKSVEDLALEGKIRSKQEAIDHVIRFWG